MLNLPIFLISLIIVAICIFMINYYNETRCASDRTENELDIYSISINKRLLQAESETLKNSIYIDDMLKKLHSNLFQLEISKLDHIMNVMNFDFDKNNINDISSYTYKSEVPKYHLDSIYLDAEILADKIDEVFKSINSDDELDRRIDVGNTGLSNSKINEEESHETLSSKEKDDKCNYWLKFYSVVKGVSWGDLPYDLQKKWVILLYYIFINIIIFIIINL
jgi:hypothetical protein